MLKVTVDNFKYHRILLDNVTLADTKDLKEEYDYSFVISYEGFIDNDYGIVKKHAAIIDITKSIDLIYSNFHRTCRRDISRLKNYIDLEFLTNVDYTNEIFKFHKECEDERGWKPAPKEELYQSIIFIATWKGVAISGISVYGTSTKFRIGRIFSKRRSIEFEEINNKDKRLFSSISRGLIYSLCKYGKKLNMNCIDLGGIDLNDKGKSGIASYKLSFGSEVVPVNIGRYIKPGSEAKKLQLEESGYDIT